MRVKELRAKTGLSQSEFSKKFNINKGTLANWEQEIRKPPNYVIEMIETILNYEHVLNNIEVRLMKEKYKDRSKIYSEEVCQVGKNAFSMALDIVEEELQVIKND